MSKYSFEAHEKIPTVKCRPESAPLRESGGGLVVRRVEILQMAAGAGVLEIRSLPAPDSHTVLEPKLIPYGQNTPDGNFDAALAEAFIRRLGAMTDGAKGYAGVVVDSESMQERILPFLFRAWVQAFDNTVLLIRIPAQGCNNVIQLFKRDSLPFGLLLDASDGLVAIRLQLAAQGLQRVWKSAPVFLLAKHAPESREQVLRAACGWHVADADIAGLCSERMLLRRLTWPVKLSNGGALPLRFWWHNAGNCPIYEKTQVRLALRDKSGTETIIPVNDCARPRTIGDSVHNEILLLPEMKPGSYELGCGIFREDETPLTLDVRLPQRNGFYALGALELDDVPHPELYRIWDEFYPEGYYPLEDPVLPV